MLGINSPQKSTLCHPHYINAYILLTDIHSLCLMSYIYYWFFLTLFTKQKRSIYTVNNLSFFQYIFLLLLVYMHDYYYNFYKTERAFREQRYGQYICIESLFNDCIHCLLFQF